MKKQNFLLYIDDTGLNTKEKTSTILQNEIATHAGVIIPEIAKDDLNNIMTNLGNFLYARYDTDEFHFTDIYNRNGKFKDIQIQETIQILETFTELFKTYNLEIVASTINSLYFEKIEPYTEEINKALKAINLPVNEKSQTLFFTYTKAKQYIEDEYVNPNLYQIVCDEGLRKKGASLSIPGSKTTIEFKSSADDKLLQLADFAAWFMTRSKNILDKVQRTKKLTELDEEILKIYSQLSPQYINSQVEIPLDGTINYDEIFNSIIREE